MILTTRHPSISPVSDVTATPAPARPPSAPGDGVHLVEEQDARRRRPGLVEQLADVRLALPEPHRQQLGPWRGIKSKQPGACRA